MKIGFDVTTWKPKAMTEYTNEELIEYYYKLRFSFMGKNEKPDVTSKQFSPWACAYDMQAEILSRMEGK